MMLVPQIIAMPINGQVSCIVMTIISRSCYITRMSLSAILRFITVVLKIRCSVVRNSNMSLFFLVCGLFGTFDVGRLVLLIFLLFEIRVHVPLLWMIIMGVR